MEFVKPGFTIESEIDGEDILRRLELAGRTCYKSEDRITSDSARKFVASILRSGHESVIEHVSISVRLICDRGVTHEVMRHRLAAYSQESTRYCNYLSKGIKLIVPFFYAGNPKRLAIWQRVMDVIEEAYNELIADGSTPQEARSVLPNSLKTEIVMTYNLREWRHFFRLRCSRRAHPQMREVAIPMLREFQRRIPVIFDDITADE